MAMMKMMTMTKMMNVMLVRLIGDESTRCHST